jgi:membrane associated rhomboid family serine protease
MSADFTRNMRGTLFVVAVLLMVQLAFAPRPLHVASTATGVVWIVAAAIIVFSPNLRVRTRVAGLLLLLIVVVIVSEIVSGSVVFVLDGSQPVSHWLRSASFGAAVELANILVVLGLGWLLAFTLKKVQQIRRPNST